MQTSSVPSRVAILGGGFAGSMVAFHLLRLAPDCHVSVIEPRIELGLGAAYSAARDCHILNVQAERMGADPADPHEFHRWLLESNLATDPNSFQPRRRYAEYLGSKLRETISKSGPRLSHVRQHAVEVTKAGNSYKVVLSNGATLSVEAIVIALGNQAPELPPPLEPLKSDSSVVTNPWVGDGLEKSRGKRHVTVIGTGLTAVDVVLELLDRKYAGEILLLSRRGLLPRPHALKATLPPGFETKSSNLRGLVRELRLASESGPWPPLLDSLRGRTQTLWQSFAPKERESFLRHLRPYWEVHRHRIPEETHRILEGLLANGRLTIEAGRISSGKRNGDRIELEWTQRRTGGNRKVQTDLLINCAGPSPVVGTSAPPVVRSLCEQGLARPDSHDLGLAVEQNHRLIHKDGSVAPDAWAIGAVAKGILWETTAVRELRDQALRVATDISQVWLQARIAA
jgi:uncharacterized NAD(P)/FAD-binding protein YdhS